MSQRSQLLMPESAGVESGAVEPNRKMSVDPNVVTVEPVGQALTSAMKLAAFKFRTQRYMQLLFRMFSM
jgi:hypothetical protein